MKTNQDQLERMNLCKALADMRLSDLIRLRGFCIEQKATPEAVALLDAAISIKSEGKVM